MKRIIAAFLAVVLLSPLTLTYNNEIHEKILKNQTEDAKPSIENYGSYNFTILKQQLGAFIYTKCNGIEKRTPIIQALLNPIDVDDNPDTGENGGDVRITAYPFPYVQQVGGKWILAISLVFKIIRLGEEIKDSDFEAYVQIDFQGQTFRAGIGSAYGEELPKEARLVFTVVPYLMYDKEPEYYINLEPVFEGNSSKVSIFGEYIGKSHQYMQIDFNPAITTMIKFVPSVKIGHAGITIQRFASEETTLKMIYKGKFNANLTIEDIPVTMSFDLAISERHFEYEASDEFNVSMIIEGNHQACATIRYLPRHIVIDGGLDGYVNIFADNKKTELILADKIKEPSSFIKISNLTGNITFKWKVGLNGFLVVDGGKNAFIELSALKGVFDLKAIKKATNFSFTWNLALNGSISIDTNWEWLAEYSINFTLENFGIYIKASFLRAEDYTAEWNTSPPSFITYGNMDFIGGIDFSIMINGIWYPLF